MFFLYAVCFCGNTVRVDTHDTKAFVAEASLDTPQWSDLLLVNEYNGKLDSMGLLMPVCLLSDFLYLLCRRAESL